jgi:hypothetical protein
MTIIDKIVIIIKSVCVIALGIIPFFIPQNSLLYNAIDLNVNHILSLLISTVGSTMLLYFAIKIVNRIELNKPKWKSNPFNYRNIMSIIHFVAICSISFGFSMIVNYYFKNSMINTISILIFLFGIGLIIGIYLAFIMDRK